MPSSAAISTEVHPGWLRLVVGDEHADFHHLWLRHNADEDRHPQTRERIICSSDLDDDVHPDAIVVDGEALEVQWSDGARRRYPVSWLMQHAYARGRADVKAPASDLDDVTIVRGEADTAAAVIDPLLQRLRRHGVVVLRRGASRVDPADETESFIAAFESRGLSTITTHFGRVEDLRPDNTTNTNTDQLGYTHAGIEPHTDQPFLDRPPRYQLLQSIVPAADGGDSFVVDAEAAARYLRSIDADAWHQLTTVPVRFHRQQKQFERVVVAPIIDPVGPRGFQVRLSYFTMAPHQRPFAEMEGWYRAYNRFARLVRDARHQRRFKLEAGDVVVYDNLRQLHGRTPFTGGRWLRGIYFDD